MNLDPMTLMLILHIIILLIVVFDIVFTLIVHGNITPLVALLTQLLLALESKPAPSKDEGKPSQE